jgi:glucosamine 6-phosphate synthetase-like amidotransferase/phosphosugar isomerase protein
MRIPTSGITCTEKSELEVECDSALVLRTADEKSTVMTRSFTSMLISLQWLAARHAGNAEFCNSLEAMATQFATRIHSLAEQVENFTARLSFEDCLKFANCAGALSVTRAGGTEAFRDGAHREAFLRKHAARSGQSGATPSKPVA